VEQEKQNAGDFQILEQNLNEDVLTLKVRVDTDVVNRAYRKVHRQLLKQVKVPGFRPGKVPLPVLSNAIGKENFVKEVRKELLPTYYYNALGVTAYRPASEVVYEEEHLAHGEPFAFCAKVSVLPHVNLGDYNTIKVNKGAPKPVGDEEVEKSLKDRQRRYAKTRHAEDETIRDGDFVLLSFSVTIDGREYKTLTQNNAGFVVGEDRFITGFDANLIGRKKAEEFTFAMELPKKGLDNESLHGKKCLVKGKIKSVQRLELPGLDDEFAKDVGAFENLEDLKKKIRLDLEKDHERTAKEEFSEELRKLLLEKAVVEFPESLLSKEIDRRLEEFKESFEGKPFGFEDYLVETSRDVNSFREEFRAKAVSDLKLQCVLDEIAARETLQVTDEEFLQRIHLMAQALRRDEEEILERLDSFGKRILHRQEMLREKAFTALRDRLQ